MGNLLVHDDIYLVQLYCDSVDLDKLAIPTINDQLTNAQIHGAQALRNQDLTPWTHHELFQLVFGIFHLTMNLIWAMLHTHQGTVNQDGSLSHFFAVMEKVRLGANRPDFHTLLAALNQIINGLVMNAWRKQCGFPSLKEFMVSQPTTKRIIKIVQDIIWKYATPTKTIPPVEKSTSTRKSTCQSDTMPGSESSDSKEELHEEQLEQVDFT